MDEASPEHDVAPAAMPAATGGDRLLELYKLAVEMADRISARRATANAFFLTLNSALLAIVGLVKPTEGGGTSGRAMTDRFGVVLLSVAGLTLALSWWVLLRSYRDLNHAKFLVVNEMERQLPTAPFSEEWKHLMSERSRKPWTRYVELGRAERLVPLIYAAVYVAAAIRALFFTA